MQHKPDLGTCLCQSVKICVKGMQETISACHCNMCRTWGGGPLFAVDCGSTVSFVGEDAITVYGSSPWAERAFCRHCGTHLYFRYREDGRYMLPLGLFPDLPDLRFTQQLFIAEKPHFYSFAEETEKFEADPPR